MLEFTSALYLGLRHGSWSLEPWSQLTTGSPAAFAVPTAARAVARELAALQGCAAATLGPSTLHLFWDLGELFAESGAAIYLDSGTYPIGKWGMERAAAHGAQLRRFSHHDPDALWRLLRSESRNRRPVVVSDGFCPGCGRPAPLEAYLELARRGDGWLVIDDTQALGIFGHSPDGSRPFGEGGGGMARWSRISDPRLVVVASLAKAFGAPLAALSGSVAFVERFEKRSGTRMHCSPPSAAVLSAAARALTINRRRGEILRARLTSLVRHFRASLRAIGIVPTGGVFPLQTLPPVAGIDATELHQRLQAAGISTVLHRHPKRRLACLSFLINARHTREMIDRAAHILDEVVASGGSSTRKEHYHDEYLHL